MSPRIWLAFAALALTAGCRGAAGRAAALPHPTDLSGWLALAVVLIGLWWVALKIFRG